MSLWLLSYQMLPKRRGATNLSKTKTPNRTKFHCWVGLLKVGALCCLLFHYLPLCGLCSWCATKTWPILSPTFPAPLGEAGLRTLVQLLSPASWLAGFWDLGWLLRMKDDGTRKPFMHGV